MKKHLWTGISVFLLGLAAAAGDYVVREGDDWRPIRFDVTKIEKDSILDFGALLNHHRPAGKYGALKVVGDHFEFEKLPGVKQRFFGVNLSEASNLPSKEDAPRLAEAIARAGYNSVRFHHYDDLIVRKDGDTTTEMDPEKIDRFDFLIKQFKDRGIYVTIDLYCSRQVSKAEMPEVYHPIGHWNYKNAVYLVDSARENFLTFVKNFMTRKNPYTGLTYAEDPAFTFISTLNENRVLADWDPKNSGARGWQWEQLFVDWCKQKGIPKEKQSDLRLRQRFIQEFQQKHSVKMRDALRAIGLNNPLTDQNNGPEPLLLLTRANNDYTDMHFYIGHPEIVGNNWRPPVKCNQASWMELLDDKYPAKLPGSRTYGRPFTVTELKWCKPLKARGEGGAISGSIAAFQDWDALYTFQWAWGGKDYLKEAWGGYFDLYGDPITYLSDRMVHLLFLRGDVKPSEISTTLVLPKDAAKLDPAKTDLPKLCAPLSLVAKIGNATDAPDDGGYSWEIDSDSSEAALVKRLSNTTIGAKGVFDPANRHYVSSTGEMELDGKANIFKVVTPKSEALVFVDAADAKGDVLSVRNHAPYTTFFASSLDENPLRDSGRILFFHLNNAAHTGMTFSDESMGQLNSYGNIPHLAHRVTGDVTLRLASGAAPQVYAVNLKGQRIGSIPSKFENGALTFTADTAGINGEAVLVYEILR